MLPTTSVACEVFAPWSGLDPALRRRGGPPAGRNPDSFYELHGFLRWFARNRRDLVADNAHLNLDGLIAQVSGPTAPSELRGSVAIVNADKLVRILERMLDPAQFLSPHGIRGPSKYHLDHNDVDLPVSGRPEGVLRAGRVDPHEADGGQLELVRPGVDAGELPACRLPAQAPPEWSPPASPCRTPPGRRNVPTLAEVADDLERRLIGILLRDPDTGRRPFNGGIERYDTDPHFKDHLLFHEYFHGGDRDDQFAGTGLGASHQTGWTGLVANLIQERGARQRAGELGVPED